ncbi:PAS domain-containing protein [Paludibacterium paludis]|uniref:Diguanylate cyclase n=1 Tax=Paludibacterium paludis TaxID=1225769 RepID=A0A918P5M0_9NEIS|nr:PAS domain S-box protein [Paludibacterium paludis]GGY22302.1 diguanylate cyclase [Paludibacterium paludis]
MPPRQHLTRGTLLFVVLIYASVAAIWILLSDKVIEWIFPTPSELILASTFKGWAFIAVTALLLYGMLTKLTREETEAERKIRLEYRPSRVYAGLSLIALVLTAAGLGLTVSRDQEKIADRLKAISYSKSREISDWLGERRGDAELVRRDLRYADLYRRWKQSGDRQAAQRLFASLDVLRTLRGYRTISLHSPSGECLWSSPAQRCPALPARQAFIRRLAEAPRPLSEHFGPYPLDNGAAGLDFLAPLETGGGPRPVVVLSTDSTLWLQTTLSNWPVPSRSGEALLFREEGGQVVFLNKPRHLDTTWSSLRLPVNSPTLLAARLLRGEAHPGEPVTGSDYRGHSVIGVIRNVNGTDWYLVAKMDVPEMYAEALTDGVWVGLAGLLAMFIIALLRQRELLFLAGQTSRSQEERLHAMQLIGEIADSSEDAIFAKDLEGRYLLFNRAASRFVGQPAENVLGKDDRAIFPEHQASMLMELGRQAIAENAIRTREECLSLPDGERIFLATKGPLRDDNGNTIGLFGISRDITERKKAESVLRESEGRFRALVEQSLAGIYIVQNGRLCYANPGFARIFGYEDPNELLEEAELSKLAGLAERNLITDNMERCLREECEDLHFAFTGRRRDGSPIEVEIYGHRADYQGHPAVIGLILDITERKNAERDLASQAAALQQSNAELIRTNQAMIGRELAMVELKLQLNDLSRRLGLPLPYVQAELNAASCAPPEDRHDA